LAQEEGVLLVEMGQQGKEKYSEYKDFFLMGKGKEG